MSIALPAILYKCPGPHEGRLNGKWVLHNTVGAWTQEDIAKYLAAGWFPSLEEAHAVHSKTPTKSASVPAPALKQLDLEPVRAKFEAPTREELETKARELEIHFDGRTTDKLLMQRIADALGG